MVNVRPRGRTTLEVTATSTSPVRQGQPQRVDSPSQAAAASDLLSKVADRSTTGQGPRAASRGVAGAVLPLQIGSLFRQSSRPASPLHQVRSVSPTLRQLHLLPSELSIFKGSRSPTASILIRPSAPMSPIKTGGSQGSNGQMGSAASEHGNGAADAQNIGRSPPPSTAAGLTSAAAATLARQPPGGALQGSVIKELDKSLAAVAATSLGNVPVPAGYPAAGVVSSSPAATGASALSGEAGDHRMQPGEPASALDRTSAALLFTVEELSELFAGPTPQLVVAGVNSQSQEQPGAGGASLLLSPRDVSLLLGTSGLLSPAGAAAITGAPPYGAPAGQAHQGGKAGWDMSPGPSSSLMASFQSLNAVIQRMVQNLGQQADRLSSAKARTPTHRPRYTIPSASEATAPRKLFSPAIAEVSCGEAAAEPAMAAPVDTQPAADGADPAGAVSSSLDCDTAEAADACALENGVFKDLVELQGGAALFAELQSQLQHFQLCGVEQVGAMLMEVKLLGKKQESFGWQQADMQRQLHRQQAALRRLIEHVQEHVNPELTSQLQAQLLQLSQKHVQEASPT